MKKRQTGTTPPVPRHALHLLATTLFLSAAPAMAQGGSTHAFHLAVQPLNRTLLSIAAESGVALSYDPKLVESVNAAPVSGNLTAAEAIAQALKGTGLELVTTDSRALSVRRAQAAPATTSENADPKADRPKRPVPAPSDAEKTTVLGAVTVSANRSRPKEDPQRAPTSSYRVTGREIDEQHITSLADLQQLVPGLNIQTTDPSDTQFTIRGIGDGGGQTSGEQNIGMPSSVAVYLDNVYLPRPGMLGGALADIDYVDVLSGAQGTTFGANSTGGVVDIHTPLPSFKPTGSTSISIGEHGYVQNKTMFSGPITDTLAGRIDFLHSSENGTVTNLANGDTLNGSSINAVRGQLLYKPDSRFSLRLSADYSNENDTPTAVLYASHTIDGSNPFLTHSNLVGNRVVYGGTDHDVDLDDENHIHLVQGGASAEANYRFDSGYNLRSVSAYRYFSYLPSQADSLSVPIYANSGTQILDRAWSQDFRLDSPHGKYFDYAVGATYLGENQATQAFTRYANSTLPGLYYGSASYDGLDVIRLGTLHDETWSAFTQGTVHVNSRFDVTAGVRLTYEKKGGQFIRYNKAPFNSGYLIQYNTLPSATLNFRYLLTRDLSSYLALSYGEKSGGLNVSAGAAKQAGYNSLVIQPERTKSAELGIKGELLDGDLIAKADVFLTYVNAFQTQSYDPSTDSTYLTNAGTFRSRGAETSLQYTPDDHFLIQTSAVYNDARYLNYHHSICPPEVTLGPDGGTAVCDLTGRQVFNAPKLTLNASVRYSWHTLNGLSSFVSARYSYRTWMYGTVDDSSFTRIPGYGLVSLAAGTGGKFSRGNWSASIWVNNLFNKTYYRRLVESDYGSVVGWIGEPRMIGGTLTYQF
ncbi:TonB-dependent receptor domain-containing protein [Paraburkholderia caballeronis]|uniref:Iron complex outermembrane recepter protein n=1 Tax=Paraburkholderia caballeronis TaxID=416943 RepID=A0A1H7LVM5_9BURK|nr:TonB-dependent receptor [Paraburkholderia caballeronis]PXW28621.1 iron complex outermembrane receptor protein [Paraburkholderia caballeronis]PXX03987.1 iron complex outermembrane receptor protein [Paraburkholderia caballeronis]RAK04731.1 iron complex outermembrane receptor protein [Paraburkholderia caballeronis]SED67641.1 iron complex outermembrane recepter protein [Paraburkholderia caballeronis]SEL03016.1 iron complex outermembrane recepter protein [Paraburkholderia caballeronis]